jgi:hypothetical protein
MGEHSQDFIKQEKSRKALHHVAAKIVIIKIKCNAQD